MRAIPGIQLSFSLPYRKPSNKSTNEDVLYKTTSDVMCFLFVCKAGQFRIDSVLQDLNVNGM